MNLLDDPEMLTDVMSMDVAELIAYQNGTGTIVPVGKDQ